MYLSLLSSIIQKVCGCHSLNSRGHKLHVCVDDSVWVLVGQLDGLPDLALPTHGPSLGDGELDGSGVPPVLLERWAAMLFVISPKCEQI